MTARRALCVLIYLVAGGVVTAEALRAPEWNFDAVGYVGAAVSGAPADVQRQAYEAIASAAPPAQAQAISGPSDYRRRLATDPEAFVAELPVYRFKWGYVALVKVALRLGLNPADATHWISTAAYVVLWVALLVWLLRRRASPVEVLAAAVLVAAPPMGELARLSTPDMLVVTLIALGATTLIAQDRRWRGVGLVCLSCAGLARPDAALTAGAVLMAWALVDRTSRRVAFVGLGAVGLLALGGVLISGPEQVATLVGRYFTSRAYADASATSGLAAYVNALGVGLRGTMLYHPSVIGLWAVAGLVAWTVLAREPTHLALRAVLLGAWLALPLRFVLFPDRSDRFYASTYAVTGFALLVALSVVRGRAHQLDVAPTVSD